jgi:regulation of enolase protein 1 (concanavalin A-like superfamily)
VSLLEFPDVPLAFHPAGPRTAAEPRPVAGGVLVHCGPKSDLFLDPAGTTERPDAERFVAPVDGDFRLSARVTVDFREVFDSGVLIGYLDEDNWFKLCAELDPERIARVVSVVTRDGASDDVNSWPIGPDGVHLRISRLGRAFALHASDDGRTWRMVRYFTMPDSTGPLRIGMLAQSPQGAGTSAEFTEVRFDRTRLVDVRDGS